MKTIVYCIMTIISLSSCSSTPVKSPLEVCAKVCKYGNVEAFQGDDLVCKCYKAPNIMRK